MPDNTVGAVNDSTNTALLKNRKTVLSTNAQMSMDDFYKIMAAQLKYQDPSSPVNSSDMLNQMAQMSMINSIENMNTMTMTTYATGMMGKDVTIAVKKTDSGKVKVEEVKGKVTGVNLSGKETTVWVNGKEYKVSQIMQVGNTGKQEEENKVENSGNTGNAGNTGNNTTPGTSTTPTNPTTPGNTTTPPTTGGTTTGSTGTPAPSGIIGTVPNTVTTGNNATVAENTAAMINAANEEQNVGEKLAPISATLKHISATGTSVENAMPPMTIIEESGVQEETLPKYSEQENKSKIITPVG